jgi:hypothetical protein
MSFPEWQEARNAEKKNNANLISVVSGKDVAASERVAYP